MSWGSSARGCYWEKQVLSRCFEERTVITINQVVILVITEDGVVQEFIKNKFEYLPLLKDTIKDWKQKNVVYNSNILELNNT